MTPTETVLWVGVATLGVVGSAVWSGFETGTYTLSRVRLGVRASGETPDRAARLLRRALDRPNRLLATILVGNNACNFIGTLGLGMLLQATGLPEPAIVVLQVVLLTPLLLIFGEALPKELFRVNADRLPYALITPVAVVQGVLHWSGLLPMLTALGHGVLRLTGSPGDVAIRTGRERVAELIRESASAGHLSAAQGSLADRALRFGRASVADAMVPWPSVRIVPAGLTHSQLREAVRGDARTWIPVVRAGEVIAVVNQFDLLHSGRPGGELVRPAFVSPSDAAHRALAVIKSAEAPVAIVTTEGRPVGLVTHKDLLEPLISAEWLPGMDGS